MTTKNQTDKGHFGPFLCLDEFVLVILFPGLVGK